MAQNQVSIEQLPLQQLNSVKQQMEQEIQVLTGSFGTLKSALAKFSNSSESLSTFTPENKDKTILVPLTNSLYVPGKLSNVENVIVDIGTGYFVEKDIESAKDFYKRKQEFLKKNIEGLQNTMLLKQKQYNILIDVMKQKISVLEQEEKGAKD